MGVATCDLSSCTVNRPHPPWSLPLVRMAPFHHPCTLFFPPPPLSCLLFLHYFISLFPSPFLFVFFLESFPLKQHTEHLPFYNPKLSFNLKQYLRIDTWFFLPCSPPPAKPFFPCPPPPKLPSRGLRVSISQTISISSPLLHTIPPSTIPQAYFSQIPSLSWWCFLGSPPNHYFFPPPSWGCLRVTFKDAPPPSPLFLSYTFPPDECFSWDAFPVSPLSPSGPLGPFHLGHPFNPQ